MHCIVYKSPKRDLLYLFVPGEEKFERVPEALTKSFGEPEKVMELTLEAGRQLAYTTADEVMANLESQGYHLQMPPKEGRL